MSNSNLVIRWIYKTEKEVILMNELGKEIIKAKVTLVMTGYGYLTLTDKALY